MDNFIAMCGKEPNMDLRNQMVARLRKWFPSRWGSANKQQGIDLFTAFVTSESILSMQPLPQAQHPTEVTLEQQSSAWLEAPQHATKSHYNRSLHVGYGFNIYMTASADCRSEQDFKVVAKFKHEIYSGMEDKWRVPDHVEALIMGVMAMEKHPTAISCIAEYHSDDLGQSKDQWRLRIERRTEAFQQQQVDNCGVCCHAQQSGKLVVTMYSRAHLERFKERHLKPHAQEFCHIMHNLIHNPGWQQSYFEAKDRASWLKDAKNNQIS